MDDFQDKSDRFCAWFKANGGALRDDLIEIRDLGSRKAGRGIVAIKDIPRETVLFTIPRALILSVETSELCEKIPAIFDESSSDEDVEPLDTWARLILVLLYEYLQGINSKWKPYFDVLPDKFDTPIFWSETELEALRGTCLTDEKIGKTESENMLRTRILPIIRNNTSIFFSRESSHMRDADLLALAHRMGSTIMAYAFDLETENEQLDEEIDGWVEDREGNTMLGMVPMADMLNADAEFNAHVNHGECLEVASLRSSIAADCEILNYYGPLPSSELLRRYGYLSSKHHRYDVVEISWNSIRSALGKHLSISDQGLEQADDQFEQDELEDTFIMERDSKDPDDEGRLLQPAQLLEISAELEEQYKAYYRALKNLSPDLTSDKRKREDIYKVIVAEALTTKLSLYPTTIEQDRLLLARTDISDRHRMAMQVRLGEKLLLEEGLSLISNSAEEDIDSEVITKKMKQ